ncbi:hypothetical protein [Ruminococcus callidus]|uniref:hypothetical protein n=1 Tax=Ruminococcus callidus TaxID=40519 RepID=UPI003521274F
MKQIFVLTYNYTNKKLAQMAIACVIRCRSTHGKQLRVRDIIEMNRPGLYQQLSRGDKCRVGRAAVQSGNAAASDQRKEEGFNQYVLLLSSRKNMSQ